MPGASRKSLQAGASRRSLQMQRQNSMSPATGCVAVFPFPLMKKDKLDMPATAPLEKLYRFMWRRKVCGPPFFSLARRKPPIPQGKLAPLPQKLTKGDSAM